MDEQRQVQQLLTQLQQNIEQLVAAQSTPIGDVTDESHAIMAQAELIRKEAEIMHYAVTADEQAIQTAVDTTRAQRSARRGTAPPPVTHPTYHSASSFSH